MFQVQICTVLWLADTQLPDAAYATARHTHSPCLPSQPSFRYFPDMGLTYLSLRYRKQTNRQTDASPRYAYASHGKNWRENKLVIVQQHSLSLLSVFINFSENFTIIEQKALK